MRGRPRLTEKEEPPRLVSESSGEKEKHSPPLEKCPALRLKDLPPGVKDHLEKMRTLDEESIKLASEAAMAESDAYSFLTEEPSPPIEECESIMENVRHKRLCVGEIHKQKVALATAAYDMIDDFVRRLDNDIQSLDAEMRRGGSSSNNNNNKTTSAVGADKLTSRGGGKKKHHKQRAADKKASADDKNTTVKPLTLLPDTVTSLHQDAPIDPNEPVYCVCRRVSFGEMVGCDNNECRYEWFHFECVGIDKQPEGEWFCPDCRSS
mmetsp:Transcript_44870/g.61311  ORF Transcript_44870/g.61311 Transcript_44870/m.61311 type:complete len:265 (-) Transcript_44870:226-1020(-)